MENDHRRSRSGSPRRELRIKELDLDIIPPNESNMYNQKQGGSKLVVIGKPGCFAPGTKVLMYNGDIKNVEDVRVGDVLMGDDSKPRNVLDLCGDREMMYKISLRNGGSVTVNENHILSLKYTGYNRNLKDTVLDITVKDYLEKEHYYQKNYKWFRVGVDFKHQELDIKPYTFGTWLGSGSISENDKTTFNLNGTEVDLDLWLSFIPEKYKINSRGVRLHLLAGIMDGGACFDMIRNCYEFTHESELLIDDIIFVTRSLGMSVYKGKCKRSGGSILHRCYIYGTLPTRVLVNDAMQEHNDKGRIFYNLTTPFTLTEKGYGQYHGFEIDGNHRFLLADFSVVHNTGKSNLIQSLMYFKKHVIPSAIVMSGTEDSNGEYKRIIPDTFIFNTYDEDKLEDFIKRQKLAIQHLHNPWALVLLDDCMDDPSAFRKPLQNGMYKNGRHWKMLYIVSLQYCLDVKPAIRTNVDGVFILREPILKNRRSLYENYASIIPDFQTFCDIMDQLTDDHTALYIHNQTDVNNWEDCIFWYKAPYMKDKQFRFGSESFWEFHNARYNTDYVEPIY